MKTGDPVVRDLAAVVLAAGAGERLDPLTRLRPKALCPVGLQPLIDHAIARGEVMLAAAGSGMGPGQVAVNIHHGRAALEEHLGDRVHRSVEAVEPLGTAGGIGNLRSWVDGRPVLALNADAWLAATSRQLADFVTGWDGVRVRLLCVPAGRRPPDFATARYAGACLLPAPVAAVLPSEPAGLYEALWQQEWEAGRLDLVSLDVPFVDCGTPADYLAANLLEARRLASGDPDAGRGGSLVAADAAVDPGARVRGSVVGSGAALHEGSETVDSVVWPGSVVHRRERLRCAVRAGAVTLLVR